jgi:hypothetical protein
LGCGLKVDVKEVSDTFDEICLFRTQNETFLHVLKTSTTRLSPCHVVLLVLFVMVLAVAGMGGSRSLDGQIERLRRCETIDESEVEQLCLKAR